MSLSPDWATGFAAAIVASVVLRLKLLPLMLKYVEHRHLASMPQDDAENWHSR